MVMTTRKGTVYLVGAGPGDPKLLTLRGKECLEQADVVLYDYLANEALLQHVPSTAERLYVGRRGRGHYRDQSEINRLLVDQARAGKCVVRLKGGDPFVFGRGGEEAEAVAAAGLEYEVVPGVTAAVAAPAYAGIPVTHRTLASTVTFITGHEDPTKERSSIEWTRLATVHGTLVFLMGMTNLPKIVQCLRAEGKAGTTPVAVIRWGTRVSQRTVVGTLDDIVARAAAAHMEPPTVIVIGEVVGLQERLMRLGNAIPIIFVSAHGDVPMVARAMRDGAFDFLQKPFNEQHLLDRVQEAVQVAARRRNEKVWLADVQGRLDCLTARERDVMEGMVAGRLNKQIADDLGISMKTVEQHRSRVMEKLRVDSLAELVRMVVLAGDQSD